MPGLPLHSGTQGGAAAAHGRGGSALVRTGHPGSSSMRTPGGFDTSAANASGMLLSLFPVLWSQSGLRVWLLHCCPGCCTVPWLPTGLWSVFFLSFVYCVRDYIGAFAVHVFLS